MSKFIINEEEKRRILMMHHSATKKQYLKEQDDFEDDLMNKYGKPSYGEKENGRSTADGKMSDGKINSLKNSEYDEFDDMINKPGYGKNLISGVEAIVENKTTGKKEVVNMEYIEEDNAMTVLDPTRVPTADLLNYYKENYGYYIYGTLDKSDYSVGDSIVVTATLPFELGGSIIPNQGGAKECITSADKTVIGEKTNIKLYCTIKENPNNVGKLCIIRIKYDIEEGSPFGYNKYVTFHLHFK